MTCAAVVGLGYVGLPLAVELGKRIPTLGFDLSNRKVECIRNGMDPTGELPSEDVRSASHLRVTDRPEHLAEADIIIVAVPTPVDDAHQPDLSPLVGASETIGRHMKAGAVVVFESTVYPGATDEVCVPVLEANSGKRWKRDFWIGYSPERINPGDREHTLARVVKVVSGDTPETLEKVASLYELIVTAGVYRASRV